MLFQQNLIPSIKYPDVTTTIFNLLATVLFLITLLIFIKQAAYHGKFHKGLKAFLLVGFVSGLVVYVIKIFEDTMMDYAVLEMIASIQYPFYIIFITPLFGVNYLFDVSYETLSLCMSSLYLLIFILVVSFKKLDMKHVKAKVEQNQ